jgi:hypothetical protein
MTETRGICTSAVPSNQRRPLPKPPSACICACVCACVWCVRACVCVYVCLRNCVHMHVCGRVCALLQTGTVRTNLTLHQSPYLRTHALSWCLQWGRPHKEEGLHVPFPRALLGAGLGALCACVRVCARVFVFIFVRLERLRRLRAIVTIIMVPYRITPYRTALRQWN